MLQKTRGIVLQVTDYAESSIIAKIYTESSGMQSYLVNSVRKHKARFSSNLFQPLTLVNLVAYHKTGRGLNRISEIGCSTPYQTIPYDFIKSSLALFINEVLYKSIREEESNDQLFGFLFHALQILDLETTDCSRFHLFLMGQLTRYLGFFPHGAYSPDTPCFNLQDGIFQSSAPMHPYFISGRSARNFYAMTQSGFHDYARVTTDGAERKELLNAFILYYELHITHGMKIRSQEVLEVVLHD